MTHGTPEPDGDTTRSPMPPEPATEPEETDMSKPKFAHNVFQTANHEAMRDWYCTVLDAHVVYE
ncbi:MAG: hypothetical protein ACRDP7_44710, partial [Trebonia sp.]